MVSFQSAQLLIEVVAEYDAIHLWELCVFSFTANDSIKRYLSMGWIRHSMETGRIGIFKLVRVALKLW